MSDASNPKFSDFEVVAHLFRLARTDQYLRVKHLIQACKEDMPEVTDEQMKRCLETLARKLER